MTIDDRESSELAFEIEEERWPGQVVVLSLFGEADLHGAPQLRDRLHRAIAEGDSDVVVDLRGVTFLDSMALGVLIGGMKRLRAQGRQLSLVGSRPEVRRLLEITELDRVLPLHATRDEALARAHSA